MAYVLAAIYLYILYRYPRVGLGIKVVFTVIALIVFAALAKIGFLWELLKILVFLPFQFIHAFFLMVYAIFFT